MYRTLRTVAVTFAVCFLAAESASAQQTTRRPSAQPDANVEVIRDIEYATVGDVSLQLDLHLPRNVERKPQLLIWIHGGGWRKGSRTANKLDFMLPAGYAVASISYRLTDVAGFPAQIHDCKAAVRWLRAHADRYGYKADLLGVAGGSAGGHLVSLLGTSGGVEELEGTLGNHTDQSSRVDAVVDFYGPSDFLLMKENKSDNLNQPNSPVALLLGGSPAEKPEVARAASPAQHVDADDAAFLIIHGTADPLVLPEQSKHFYKKLQAAGVDSQLHWVEGAGHGGPLFFGDECQEIIRKFFDQRLRAK